jgi:hypothetical protein
MTTLHVQLADSTFQFLAEEARAQGFGSPADYLAALAKAAEENQEYIEQELVKGVQSGPPREMTRKDWDELKRRLRERNEAEHDR